VRGVGGYLKDGLAALARKGRTDQGERRIASTHLIEAIEGLALERPPLPISSIHRQACAMAATLKERAPCYWVVRRIVRSLPAGLLPSSVCVGTKGSRQTSFLREGAKSIDALANRFSGRLPGVGRGDGKKLQHPFEMGAVDLHGQLPFMLRSLYPYVCDTP
jgi:hypothetical protein